MVCRKPRSTPATSKRSMPSPRECRASRNCRHSARRDLPAGPDVEHVAISGTEIIDPALAGLSISAAVLAIDRNQCRLDVRLHPAAVAADIDDRALLDQAPDTILLRRNQMLHIGLRAVSA